MDLKRALKTMEAAAVEAGHLLLDVQPQAQRLRADKDFVTDADLKSEEVIFRVLKAQYPDIPFLSEESGGEELREGYLWIVDPIDGTINFFRQDDHWGVSIGLASDGLAVAGTVYLPARRMLVSATRDSDAMLQYGGSGRNQRVKVQVNWQSSWEESQFWLGWGKERHGGEDHKKVYPVIEKLDRHTLYPQIRNAAAVDMMMVVLGRITGYVRPVADDPFDITAAGLIVERAGGIVTEMNGKPWSPFSKSLIASNGLMHEALLQLLNS